MEFKPAVGRPSRSIGFGLPLIRMEEEEDQGTAADRLRHGRAEAAMPMPAEVASRAIDALIEERRRISTVVEGTTATSFC